MHAIAMRRHWRRWIPCAFALLLSGCLALPHTGLFAMRLAVTSLGVEDIRIGPYAIKAGLDTSDVTSLIASGLGAGSLPVQATMALGLGLPAGLPPVQMSGFDWTLDMPGLDAVSGSYAQDVTLNSNDDADLRLPVAFDLLAGGDDRQALAPMIELAQQMASNGELSPGSELAITPGDLEGLGMKLPGGLLMPKVRLAVGQDGNLVPAMPAKTAGITG